MTHSSTFTAQCRCSCFDLDPCELSDNLGPTCMQDGQICQRPGDGGGGWRGWVGWACRVSLATNVPVLPLWGARDGWSCHVERAGERWRGCAAWITALPRPPGPLSLYNTQPNLLHHRPFHFPLRFFFSCSSASFRVEGPCSWLAFAPPCIFFLLVLSLSGYFLHCVIA